MFGGQLISLMPTPTSPDSTLEAPDPVQPAAQQHTLGNDRMPEDGPADLDRDLLEKLELSILRQKGNVCSQPRESPPLLDHQITPQIFSESVFYPAAGGMAGSGWDFWHINQPGHALHGQVINELRNAPQAQQAVNPPDEARASVVPGVAAEGGGPPQIQPQPVAGMGLAQASQAFIREFFQQAGRLHLLRGGQVWDANQWPQGFGVYLVWRVQPENQRQLLYIGKAGKYRRVDEKEAELNGGTLAHRLGRWTPYCFQREGPFANHFEYGPNAGVNQIQAMPHQDRYQQHVPAAQIEVECYCLSRWERYLAPSLLEALLLQGCMAENGYLPPANNEF